jgi:hypothetical protein
MLLLAFMQQHVGVFPADTIVIGIHLINGF